ncbi:hydantoinase/oxoprolinase family protein [soil metagenome]
MSHPGTSADGADGADDADGADGADDADDADGADDADDADGADDADSATVLTTAVTAPGVAGVDVGGTFTDAVVITAGGRPRMHKAATTPRDQSEGLVAAVAGAAADVDVRAIAHGTTTATNAVLERDLGTAVCLVTAGFADLLTIARQDRPSLYDLTRTRPAPVIPPDRVIGVVERIAPDGQVLTALTDAEVQRVITAVADAGAEAVAIVLLFGWADPIHERRLAQALAEALPEVHLTVSADLVGSFREYERASTCALNAAVGPLMARYLQRLRDRVVGSGPSGSTPVVTVMTSGGGTAALERMVSEPVHTLLSGPAAGVVAAARCASSAGMPDAVAFDMGGTSTDVCLIRDGRPVIDQRGQIDGLPIGTPTVGIHTVGAGGGSIASIDAGGALQVGPRSAGADPGPACYGRGGTRPTVTDAHAVLGHLTDLAGGAVRPDVDAARTAVDGLAGATAAGIIEVVRAQMARALHRVTTEAGVDPRTLALVAYGGAGPLHASALSRMLGCRAAVLPPAPGVLSAVGLLLAPRRQEVSRTVMIDLPDAGPVDLGAVCAALAQRLSGRESDIRWAADVRYAGQAHELRIPFDGPTATGPLGGSFAQAHIEAYGYAMSQARVQVVTVHAISVDTPLVDDALTGWDLGPATAPDHAMADLGDGVQPVALLARGSLVRPGRTVEGPAIITQPDSTALLLPGDRGTVDDAANLVIRDER